MERFLEGIVVLAGNYGSGKTEVAVNLAARHRETGMSVRMADLDLVNPYFRSREAREPLARMGVEVVLPPEAYLSADLPILSPVVAGMIRRPSPLTLLDVGGDGVGARVLAALADVLEDRSVQMLQVVNPHRPFTDSVDGCLRIRDAIQSASRLSVTGWVGNANLIDETTEEVLSQGLSFMRRLSDASALPLLCVTAPSHLAASLEAERPPCPVLPIFRQMVPPWKKSAAFGGSAASRTGAGGDPT